MLRVTNPPATIQVVDHTGPTYDGVVAKIVGEFNAVKPKRAPTLVYIRGDVDPVCSDNVITLCDRFNVGPNIAGLTEFLNSYQLDSKIILGQDWVMNEKGKDQVVCHEMMHAYAQIGDNYGAFPSDSCVWGYLDHPGPKDIALMRATYGPWPKHKKHGKHGAGKKGRHHHKS